MEMLFANYFVLSTILLVLLYILSFVVIRVGAGIYFRSYENDGLKRFHTSTFCFGAILTALLPIFILYDVLQAEPTALDVGVPLAFLLLSIVFVVIALVRD